jgi:periplasmic protein CpxP/Spy
MKRWLKRTLVGIFGASVLIGGLAACSHGHHGGWSMNEADALKFRERMVDRAADKLALDAAQKQRLATLVDRMQEQRKALMAGSTDPRAEFQALVKDAAFDRTRAQALVDGKLAAVREQSPQVIVAAAEFYDSLKPEQQQKVRDFMNRRGGRFGWRG